MDISALYRLSSSSSSSVLLPVSCHLPSYHSEKRRKKKLTPPHPTPHAPRTTALHYTYQFFPHDGRTQNDNARRPDVVGAAVVDTAQSPVVPLTSRKPLLLLAVGGAFCGTSVLRWQPKLSFGCVHNGDTSGSCMRTSVRLFTPSAGWSVNTKIRSVTEIWCQCQKISL